MAADKQVRGREKRPLLGAMVLVALTFVGGGCELLVGDNPPSVMCESVTGSCPAGMICNLATNQCEYPPDAVNVPDTSMAEVTPEAQPDTSDVVDVTQEPMACRSLGCTCSGAVDCDSNICADAITVTSGLYGEVNHGFCIQPCCTSTDCPGGFVCFATAAGGNYCIQPSLVGRTTPGGAIGGTTCSADSDCRSGLCATTCQDTCCSMFDSGECASGSACRYGAFPGRSIDTHYASHCTTPGGTAGNGSFCSNDGTCKSDFCDGNFCADACRNTADCGSGNCCDYAFDSTNGVIATCFSASGSSPLGTACTSDTTCGTAFCDPTSKQCTDVCYTDSDCSSVTGWRCRPELVSLMTGSASVLLCGS
jgi:hypothetical protein